MKKRANILFIAIDALRARNLGCYGYSLKTSPNIDNLAAKGVLFENAYSCTNSTDQSITTIFSGKYPASHGIVRHGERIRNEDIRRFHVSKTRLLPEFLRSMGYTTLAVDWLGRWHKRGYDYYTGRLKPSRLRLNSFLKRLFRLRKFVVAKDSAKVITDEAINLIRANHSKNFFLFLHYWDTHAPYSSPSHYVEEFTEHDYEGSESIEEILGHFDPNYRDYYFDTVLNRVTDVKEVLARYDAAVSFVDHEIGRLMEALEKYGVSEQTLVVLTSDHGESLTEHEIYFDHHGLYEVSIRVPLIFRYSGFPENKKIKGLVQHTDIVPTILDFLGMKTQSFEFDGKSMFSLICGDVKQLHSALYFEEYRTERKRAIRKGRYKYIYALSERGAICRGCGRIHGGVEELYDLNRDPEETKNVVDENPVQADVLRKKLSSWAMSFERKKDQVKKEGSKEIFYSDEEEVKERLRKLGYF